MDRIQKLFTSQYLWKFGIFTVFKMLVYFMLEVINVFYTFVDRGSFSWLRCWLMPRWWQLLMLVCLLNDEDVPLVLAQNLGFVCTVCHSGFALLFWSFFLEMWLSQLQKYYTCNISNKLSPVMLWLTCNPIQSKFQCWVVQ